MKIKDLLYKAPEMTEEKLLEIIEANLGLLKGRNSTLIKRIQTINKHSDDINKLILKEYDLIQDKKSYLTKSQRETILGYVGYCMIIMAKQNEKQEDSDSSISEAEVIRDDSNSGESL